MAKVIVIGGGAAGMAAAIEAARLGDRVTVLERMDRVGKKLLATGNGRCNLMNVESPRYPGGEGLALAVLNRCGPKEQACFWKELGLNLRTEDGGRVYPVSGQASSVLDTLRLAMDRLAVEVVTGAAVDSIQHGKKGFTVTAGDGRWTADRVIVAAGGCAQPKLGSDGSIYPLLTALGHHVVKPCPSLTQIITDAAPIRGLSGIRVKAEVKVLERGRVVHQEQGEALFADYGMSGVCVMQCARYVTPDCQLVLDLAPGMGFRDAHEVEAELLRRRTLWKNQPMEQIMTGLCVSRLASALCAAAGVQWKGRTMGSLTKAEAHAVAAQITGFTLNVRGLKGLETAQVTRGGVKCSEVEPEALESRILPGLHIVGETLDVDGDCGGFNLMFAFGCGILAGRNHR